MVPLVPTSPPPATHAPVPGIEDSVAEAEEGMTTANTALMSASPLSTPAATDHPHAVPRDQDFEQYAFFLAVLPRPSS